MGKTKNKSRRKRAAQEADEAEFALPAAKKPRFAADSQVGLPLNDFSNVNNQYTGTELATGSRRSVSTTSLRTLNCYNPHCDRTLCPYEHSGRSTSFTPAPLNSGATSSNSLLQSSFPPSLPTSVESQEFVKRVSFIDLTRSSFQPSTSSLTISSTVSADDEILELDPKEAMAFFPQIGESSTPGRRERQRRRKNAVPYTGPVIDLASDPVESSLLPPLRISFEEGSSKGVIQATEGAGPSRSAMAKSRDSAAPVKGSTGLDCIGNGDLQSDQVLSANHSHHDLDLQRCLAIFPLHPNWKDVDALRMWAQSFGDIEHICVMPLKGFICFRSVQAVEAAYNSPRSGCALNTLTDMRCYRVIGNQKPLISTESIKTLRPAPLPLQPMPPNLSKGQRKRWRKAQQLLAAQQVRDQTEIVPSQLPPAPSLVTDKIAKPHFSPETGLLPMEEDCIPLPQSAASVEYLRPQKLNRKNRLGQAPALAVPTTSSSTVRDLPNEQPKASTLPAPHRTLYHRLGMHLLPHDDDFPQPEQEFVDLTYESPPLAPTPLPNVEDDELITGLSSPALHVETAQALKCDDILPHSAPISRNTVQEDIFMDDVREEGSGDLRGVKPQFRAPNDSSEDEGGVITATLFEKQSSRSSETSEDANSSPKDVTILADGLETVPSLPKIPLPPVTDIVRSGNENMPDAEAFIAEAISNAAAPASVVELKRIELKRQISLTRQALLRMSTTSVAQPLSSASLPPPNTSNSTESVESLTRTSTSQLCPDDLRVSLQGNVICASKTDLSLPAASSFKDTAPVPATDGSWMTAESVPPLPSSGLREVLLGAQIARIKILMDRLKNARSATEKRSISRTVKACESEFDERVNQSSTFLSILPSVLILVTQVAQIRSGTIRSKQSQHIQVSFQWPCSNTAIIEWSDDET